MIDEPVGTFVPGELARPVVSLPAMLSSDPRTRAGRLARLRETRGVEPPEGARHEGSAAEAQRDERARSPGESAVTRGAKLASDLGGRLVEGPAGPVVVVESRTALPARLDGLRALPDPPDPERPFICLDTETTGLGTGTGHVAFIVGLGWWEGSDFVVRQLVLADHADEPALLAQLATHLPADACLVTYNGRTFDWPLLVSRFRLAGGPPPAIGRHLDLLPLARQA